MHGINFVIVNPSGTSQRTKMRMGDTHARKIRRVCGGTKDQCNTGWMSDLQEAVKPSLLPMINGENTTLSRREQKTIAAWAAMTAMTGEFLDSSDEFVAVPQWQRDYLRENQRVPPGWRIWIGRYRWAQGVERWCHHVMCLGDERDGIPAGDTSQPQNTQTTTICVGDHFVVHIMSSAVAAGESIVSRWRFPDTIRPCLSQIFPAAKPKVRWPPEGTLSPAGLHYVANTFFERCSALSMKQSLGGPG